MSIFTPMMPERGERYASERASNPTENVFSVESDSDLCAAMQADLPPLLVGEAEWMQNGQTKTEAVATYCEVLVCLVCAAMQAD